MELQSCIMEEFLKLTSPCKKKKNLTILFSASICFYIKFHNEIEVWKLNMNLGMQLLLGVCGELDPGPNSDRKIYRHSWSLYKLGQCLYGTCTALPYMNTLKHLMIVYNTQYSGNAV